MCSKYFYYGVHDLKILAITTAENASVTQGTTGMVHVSLALGSFCHINSAVCVVTNEIKKYSGKKFFLEIIAIEKQ